MSSKGNVEDWGFCFHCNRQMSLKQMLAHVCPDKPLELVLTAKGRRMTDKRRKH